MTHKRATTQLLTILFAAALTTSCGDDPVEPLPPPATPTAVTVSPASATLQSLQETVQLTATVKNQHGQTMSGISVSWTSSDPALGTVSSSGLVTAVANGTVTVTATAGSVSGSATLTIEQVPADVSVAPDSLVLGAIGDTVRVEAAFADANGHAIAGVAAEWASEDPAVATVDASGLVTAVANGTVAVTATASSVSGSVTLTVQQVPADVSVAPDSLVLGAIGDTVRVEAAFTDANGHAIADAGAEWVSADPTIATVDASGLVTAVANGSVAVTATAGTVSGSATLTVKQVPADVSVAPDSVVLGAIGDTVRVEATFADANGHPIADAGAEWASADPAVATVDASGLVTAVANGTVEVTATAGSVSGSATLTIQQVPADVAVASDSLVLGAIGDTIRVEATFVDANGHPIADAGPEWASGDPAVATVDASGLVTAVANGTVTVTVTAGSVSGSVSVTVDQVPAEVLVEPAADTLVASGDTLRLSADAVDSNGNAVAGAVFAWASTDTLVAVVDDEGLVTGVAAGEVEVTATSEGSTGRARLIVVAPVPTTVAISPDTVAFSALGQTARLAAEVRDQIGRVMEGEPVSWSSGDPLVATVDSAGVVTATGAGATTVAASAGSASATAVVTVTQSAGRVVVSPPAATIALGDTLRLTAEAFDENGHLVADAEFDWSSSDLSVARVDESGLVTAAGEGQATVTAVSDGARATAEITVENPDRASLVAIYNATGGPNWVDNTNWLSDRPVGEWYGVTTDEVGRVVGLDLSGKPDDRPGADYVAHGLRGVIPPELGNLANLRDLSLRANDLSGAIPSALGNLRQLQTLDLSYNALSGAIPPELGDLKRLIRFAARNNRDFVSATGLSGSIPAELGNLTSVEVIDLQSNLLSGPIPAELGSLTNLTVLFLDNNDLSGPIPPEIGELYKLVALDFYVNDLSGPIPRALGNLANLRLLELGYNQLSGPIPPELGNLTNLQSLSISGNLLSGPIPPELGDLANLRRLSFGDNQLTGALPSSLLALRLQRFDSYCFGIRDAACAPNTPGYLSWLEEVSWTGVFCNASDRAALSDLFREAGGGAWRESQGWMDNPLLEEWHGVEVDSLGRVTALDLSDNDVSGVLPASIGNLAELTSLRIDGNDLGGRLPLGLTALDLEEFHYDGTDMCVPDEAEFRKWLDGISSHRGTSIQCQPLTDRDVLADLYHGTGGRNWVSGRNWLTDAPLGAWHGVSVDSQGRVVGLVLSANNLSGRIPKVVGRLSNLRFLNLAGNDLTGELPPELGALSKLESLTLERNALAGRIPEQLGRLSNLRRLDLGGNDLTGELPPELGGLSKLEHLRLGRNAFLGRIPEQLGRLSNLRTLVLGGNYLTGELPPELGGLSKLQYLDLQSNALAGEIPAELGGLSKLSTLALRNNRLAGPIPPELGRLTSLRYLLLGSAISDVGYNQLSGPLPREVGNLTKLIGMDLRLNALSGPIPAELGHLRSLRSLELQGNVEMAGAMPESITELPLDALMAHGTSLCIPRDPAFSLWLTAVGEQRIARCGETSAYLVQAVQSRSHPVPLVAGEDALLRILIAAAVETTEGLPKVRAHFYVDGIERHSVLFAGNSVPIPTVIEEGELSRSVNMKVPGSIVRPGLEMVIDIDPDGTLDTSLGVPRRIPEQGRMAIEVQEMPVLDLMAIPFVWDSDPDSAILGTVEGMAADPQGHALLEETRVLLPVADIDVTVHDPVVSSSNNAYDLGWQIEAIRVLEGGEGYYYMGMMSGTVTGSAGVAVVAGRTSFSIPDSRVIAHELGHNMSLRHPMNCGFPSTHDQWYPYPRGRIGAWGYDFSSDRLVSAYRRDLMSYCHPHWVSDYHFINALRYRLGNEAPVGMAAQPTKSLLLWGGVDTAGNPFLEPAFVAQAPPALPDSAGDWSVTGRDASGRELFALSFAMPVAQSEAGDVSSFAFMLPVQLAWAANLASITLDGPDGSATLDEGSDVSTAILRDPVTGQVRGFLRGPPLQAAADAAAQAAGSGYEVLFSRGIPEVGEWRR